MGVALKVLNTVPKSGVSYGRLRSVAANWLEVYNRITLDGHVPQ